MNTVIIVAALMVGLGQTPLPTYPRPSPTYPTPQALSQKRDSLQAEVAITTLAAADLKSLPRDKAIEHDSEVSRSETITVVVDIQACQSDAAGACNASADVIAYKPDGSIHSEMKNVSLATRRGTVVLGLVPGDVTGVYKVVATVRDLNARRVAKTERLFGVK